MTDSFLDVNNPDFILDYELGIWWAIYGKQYGSVLYLDSDWYRHVGFYLGVAHGSCLYANDLDFDGLWCGVILADSDVISSVDVVDELVLQLYHKWLQDCPGHRLLALEFVTFICRIILIFTYRTLCGLASEAVTAVDVQRSRIRDL